MHIDPTLPLFPCSARTTRQMTSCSRRGSSEPPSTHVVRSCSPAVTEPIPKP